MDPPAAPKGRLFRKYLLALVLLVGTVVLASGFVEALFSYRDNKGSITQIEQGRAGSAAFAIDQQVGEIERDVYAIRRPGQQLGEAGLKRRLGDFLQLLHQLPAIADVTYIDSSGRERVRVSRVAVDFVDLKGSGPDRSKDAAFIATRIHSGTTCEDLPTFYGPVTFRNLFEPYMTMAIGECAPQSGAIVADVSLSFVGDVLKRVRVGRAGSAYAVDGRGELILHSNPTLVLRRTPVKDLPQVRAALAGGAAAGVTGRDPSGAQVLSASEPISTLGWHVFVEQPVSEAFAPLRRAINRTILVLAAGLALAAAVSFFFVRRMTTPIRALQEGAARIGAGDLEQTIEVNTGDELEALAGEFNRMTVQLKESYAGLELKVDERTRELAVAMEQLAEKGREVETVSRHKSEFLAGMSHELRTPLNAIIGFSEVLDEQMFGELNERQKDYVGDILTAGRHLLSLINDILDLSKVEAGKMELELGQVSIPETLASGLTMHRERATNHGIHLTLDVPDGLEPVVADERKVRQVVFNLLSNAVKFTPDGGRIDVSARAVDGVVQVAVSDTGVGISASDAEKIFEEFQQVGPSAGKSEGTGLGLALSRRFVELHGGRLWVESEPGAGSTFTFTLPVHGPE